MLWISNAHAPKTYEQYMALHHLSFEMTRCGMFINKEFPYIHDTADFLVSCDCCGRGCGEVKCPISITNVDFGEYSKKASSCLESVNQRLQQVNKSTRFWEEPWACTPHSTLGISPSIPAVLKLNSSEPPCLSTFPLNGAFDGASL